MGKSQSKYDKGIELKNTEQYSEALIWFNFKLLL